YQLLSAIRQQNPKAEFFCVGDDWQAINGFAGSELRFFHNFRDYFGPFQQEYITKNYRSKRLVVEAGNALMHGRGKPANAYEPEP
ncbi:hypothetical protein ACFMJL_23990, partial [Acinetobacter baumannii]